MERSPASRDALAAELLRILTTASTPSGSSSDSESIDLNGQEFREMLARYIELTDQALHEMRTRITSLENIVSPP